ncbi:hypothetical protein CKO11_10605 [Rhodobacter sp. TJ_12]|uniref:YIP1 family protein n=1 Tax=Rhodobacter sp. TJ_12 TaxID=2029399 RepID=UPI001CC1B86F|nr:YIP1 family protein [Rhodobacter sp. TJ_12]MBZ4022909.1 hypothetical protein [Rhodobacter sp. TJ_12]
MSLALYLSLVRQSLTDPPEAARRVIALLDSAKARWLALAAVVTAGAALGTFGELLFSLVTGVDLGPSASPVRLGLIQGALMIYAAAAMAVFGRQVGGKGDFAGAFALVVWIQAIMVGAQLVQIVVMTIFPLIGVLMTLTLFVLMIWLLVQFTAALHGFESLMWTSVGVLAVLFGSAMMLGSLFLALGIAPPFMAES